MSPPEPLDFDQFHRVELPRRLAAGNGALAARGADLGSLAVRLPDGAAYQYRPRPGGIDVRAGDDADTVVELSHESWQGIVDELETAPGLTYAGTVKCLKGDLMSFVRWEPALRAMFNGRPIHDADQPLEDRDGRPLDPRRAFRLDDGRDDMAQFLRMAGYLLVKSVFSRAEIARLVATGERLAGQARAGDKRSWWGMNARGEEILCRVTHAGLVPELLGLYRDPRLLELVSLADTPLSARGAKSEQGVTVLFKNPDMTEGLSDLPWHRDCGMGGHAVMCPVINLSIFLGEASSDAGELRMLPGSWQCSVGFAEADDPDAPQGIALAAEAGDVSLHYGDTVHAAPPPRGAGPYRSSVILTFAREGAAHHRGEDSYNDALLGRADGQVENLQKVADRVRPQSRGSST